MTESITSTLLTMGLPGIVILVLGYSCYALYRRLDAIHADRINDAKSAQERAVSALERNTAISEKVAENLETLTATINRRRDGRKP